MMNKRLLVESGFEEFEGSWGKGDWSITKSKEESRDLRANLEAGYRVCLMEDDGGVYVLSNISSDSVWICSSVNKCLDIIRQEERVE